MQFTIQLTEEQLAQISVNDSPIAYGTKIESPADSAKYLKHMGRLKKEHFVILTLDGGNQVINKHSISTGTLTASLVHPREVFVKAIEDRAASIIVAHNHPSGSLNPSTADLQVTERLKECGNIIGIQVIDHLIITQDSYTSIL